MKGSSVVTAAVSQLKKELRSHSVEVTLNGEELVFTSSDRRYALHLFGDGPLSQKHDNNLLPLDYLVSMPAKVAAFVLGKLDLNQRVFARKCVVDQLRKAEAKEFLDRFHFMGSTEAAYCFGLYYRDELLAVATFSKGRKMRRLPQEHRSFELIRFCTRPGFTITGGLSRLMKTFCEKRGAAEIMTYVDRQFSNGRAFLTAGFVVHEKTEPRQFLVDRNSFRRKLFEGGAYDSKNFYLTTNAGNLKMLYRCRLT